MGGPAAGGTILEFLSAAPATFGSLPPGPSFACQSPHGREVVTPAGEHFDGARQEDHSRPVVRVLGEQVIEDASRREEFRLFISG
jgi:hypothetical protein